MPTLVLYTLLATAFYFLGARTLVTGWLWLRYPPRLAYFMDCAMCTGFWYGVGLAFAGRAGWLPELRLAEHDAINIVTTGLAMLVLVPVVAGIVTRGLAENGHTVVPSDERDEDGPSGGAEQSGTIIASETSAGS